MSRTYRVADLFCGAGGSSTGALRAIEALGATIDLVAVNHWDVAIATHQRNHPRSAHYCVNLDAARPEDIVPGGELDLLMASPECTYFSRARGGKPVSDQSRMSAWHVQRWASTLDIRCILVENVPEFTAWGPVDPESGKPDKAKRGMYFQAWVQSLWAMGYAVEWRTLNAADYGEATTRVRFFLQARRDGTPIRWPQPTHSRTGSSDLFGGSKRWRAAREVLDLNRPGGSLFDRRKPLSVKTRLRIAQGAARFWGTLAPYYIRLLDLPRELESTLLAETAPGPATTFVVGNRNNNTAKDLDGPLPTFTTSTGGGVMLAMPTLEPFVLGQQGGGVAREAGQPLPTITTDGAIAVIDPALIPYYGQSGPASVDAPVPTVTTRARFGLVSPLVVPYGPTAEARSADQPLPTVMTRDRLEVCTPTADPFLVPGFGERPTQTPRVHSVDSPVPTIAAQGHTHLVSPALDVAHESVDRRRLVVIDGHLCCLDIRYRMLTNRELARAMGFDDDETTYEFQGTATEITKQIGNAVPCHLAAALVTAILDEREARRGAA